MAEETEVIDEQFDDSLIDDNDQSSDTATAKVRELQTKNAELESRIGSLVQKTGEDKRQMEAEYTEWAGRLKDWYDEQRAKDAKYIESLEERLIDADSQGAKVVLDERKARATEEREAQAENAKAENARIAEVRAALEEALAAFPNVGVDDLRGATTARQVWTMAGRISQQKTEASLEERVKAMVQKIKPEDNEEEIAREEAASRTPGVPRGSETAARRREDNVLAEQIKAKEEELASAKMRHRLAESIRIQGELIQLRRQAP